MRVEMEPDWKDRVLGVAVGFLSTDVGPKIAADARRYAPVRTGRLRDSIGHHMDGDDLIVDATAPYAAYVEMGHRIAYRERVEWHVLDTRYISWGEKVITPKKVPPRPFLRPALYQERG